ncbi:MAG: DUF559 domain-containing protein [Dehalococcoidia bacterium]|nr:DUF559 domain-containing protein [Dehalococcoidia bacterium]
MARGDTAPIENDGDSHAERPDYDQQRTAHLNRLGIEVMRYTTWML